MKKVAVLLGATALVTATWSAPSSSSGADGAQASSARASSNSAVKSEWRRSSFKTKTGVAVSRITDGTTTVTSYGGGEPMVPKVSGKSASVGTSSDTFGTNRRSVFELSMAAGHGRKVACDMAKGLAQPCTTMAKMKASKRAARPAWRVPWSNCTDLRTTEGDGVKYNHACSIKQFDSNPYRPPLRRPRHISARMRATGWVVRPGWIRDRITGVGVQVRWRDSDSHAVDWAPDRSITIKNSCVTKTMTVSSPAGHTYSTTSTVCPDEIHPWHSPRFQYFGAKWTGGPAGHNVKRGVTATEVHKFPFPYTRAHATWAWIRWN